MYTTTESRMLPLCKLAQTVSWVKHYLDIFVSMRSPVNNCEVSFFSVQQWGVCPNLYPIKMISSLQECTLRAQSSTRALFIAVLFKKDCTHKATGCVHAPNETTSIWMKNSWKIPEEPKLFSSFAQSTQALLCASSMIGWTLSHILSQSNRCTRGSVEDELISRVRSLLVLQTRCDTQ